MLKEQYGIAVSRNTISDDLTMLHDCDLQVEVIHSTQNKYYYDGQLFSVPGERTIEYVAPFDRCDREQNYETAWKFFEKKYGKEEK